LIDEKKVILVFSPPDKRKSIYNFLKRNTDFKIFDIDSNLCKKLEVKGLRKAITKFPRNKLLTEWRNNIQEIITTIKNSDDEITVLLGHILYYSDIPENSFQYLTSLHFPRIQMSI
jgi:hypothetical protein